jgi:hypothetical protein
MQTVQKISCSNSAAFVMNFWVEYLDPSTGEIVAVDGSGTGNYPVGQQRTVDLDSLNVPDGALVRAHVQAVLGTNNPGNKFVTYRRGSGGVATYNVTGTTLNFSVTLVG